MQLKTIVLHAIQLEIIVLLQFYNFVVTLQFYYFYCSGLDFSLSLLKTIKNVLQYQYNRIMSILLLQFTINKKYNTAYDMHLTKKFIHSLKFIVRFINGQINANYVCTGFWHRALTDIYINLNSTIFIIFVKFQI